MPDKTQLSDVELDEVSLVDSGANQKAKVVLFKRDEPACKGKGCEEIEKAPAGIQFNIGFKEEGGSEIQSVIFDSDKWDAERAKAWLKDHNMTSGKMDETTNTLRFRQHDPKDYVRFRVIQPGAGVEKALKSSDSWQRIQSVVESAARNEFAPSTTNGMMSPSLGIWIRDLYKDSMVFDQEGQTYRADYSIKRDDAGELQVVFGDKVPVEVVYQDVKKSIASPAGSIPLADIPDDLRHRVIKLRMDVLAARLRKSISKPQS